MRKITPPPSDNHPEWKPPTLRTKKKAAVYARRSDPTAKKKETDTSQSREMQTEDLIAWATGKSPERLNPCWNEEDLEPYFADLGLSGTLRPDERPDMLRLFDDIDKGVYDHGTVICFQESRLFRDDTEMNVATLDATLAQGLRLMLQSEHLGFVSDDQMLDLSRLLGQQRQTQAAQERALQFLNSLHETLADPLVALRMMHERAWENLRRYKAKQPLLSHLLPYLTASEAREQGLNFREEHGWIEEP